MHKRGLSALLSVVMTLSILPALPASALECDEPFPYTLFAGSDEDGAITINADNVCLNGSVVTNGSIETAATNFNVNGQRIEHAQQPMVYAFGKLDDAYFDSDTVLTYESDYTVEDVNISLNTPIVSTGNISLNGNINLNTQLKAEEDILVSGGSCNANNAALISHHGDIYIESTNLGFAGLIYAPYGDIVIDSSSLNLNNVIVIGQTITIDTPSLNVNHNASAANVIGTISEDPDDHHEDAGNYFYAVGAYNADTSTIDIAWSGSDVPATVDVLTATDGETYSVVTSVTDATTYAYPVGNDFVSTYFKVSYIDANGDIVESIPFQAIVTEDGITIDFPDSDGDGIVDLLEAILGTDPSKIDTDDDGLTDYQELNITGTDPTDYDSVEKRIADADADCDGDGVSNLEEIELGTDPQVLDSDDDGLTDGEEVNTYLTDPLLEDTDGDGLTDGFEVRYGLDPLSPYTNGIADAEHKIEQTISADSPVLSEVNTSDSPYEMSVSITTNGDAERGLAVTESGYSVSLENDAQIGGITDLNLSDSCDPDSIRLTYAIKDAYRSNTLNKYSEFEDLQGIKRLCVFKYFDEISMMLPLDTQYNLENNTIYADVNDGGTYCVMDLEVWFDLFDVDPTDIADEIRNSDDSTTAPTLRSPLRAMLPLSTSLETNNTPISIYILLQGAGHDETLYKKQVTAIEDFCSKIFVQFPISLIILKEQHYARSEELIPGSGIYNSINSCGTNFITAEDLNEDGEIELNDGGYFQFEGYEFDDNSGLYSALSSSLALDSCQYKFVFDFQNGNLHVDNTNNILTVCEHYNCYYSRFHSSEYTYETSIYDYNNQVHEAILDSNGIELTDIDEAAIEMVELIKSTVPWTATMLLSTNLKKAQLKGLLSPTNGIDSDEDTLNDWDEADNRYITVNADGSVSLPTIQNLLSYIDIESILDYAGHEGAARNAMFNAIRNRTVLPCKSDPTLKDTDGDEIFDSIDPNPAIKNISAKNTEEILKSLDGILDGLMPPTYDENGNVITSKNKKCSATWNYFNEMIWPGLLNKLNEDIAERYQYLSEQKRYPAYISWLESTYGVHGIEKMWLYADSLVSSFYYELIDWKHSVPKALNQIIKGNYTDDITVTGTTGQIVLSFSGVDFVADLRDVTYDLSHWQWTWKHAGQTGLDMVGIIPIIGMIKNADEYNALRKLSKLDAADALDDSVDSINELIKGGRNADEIAEIEKASILKRLIMQAKAKVVEIAGKYHNLECEQCADEIQLFLESSHLHGKRINLTDGNGFVVHDLISANEAISENGKHYAILFEGQVYDNLFPNGIDYETWLSGFYADGAVPVVKMIDF